jgi:hypothetical protein
MATTALSPEQAMFNLFVDEYNAKNRKGWGLDSVVDNDEMFAEIFDYIEQNMTASAFVQKFKTPKIKHLKVIFFWRPHMIMGVRMYNMSRGDKTHLFSKDVAKQVFVFFDDAFISLNSTKVREVVFNKVKALNLSMVNTDLGIVDLSAVHEKIGGMFTYRVYGAIEKAFQLSLVASHHYK